MARKINAMPKGYHTATPVLVVKNANAAIEYYASVFGAKELSRTYADDGVTILRAELKIGNSIIQVSDEMPAYGILSPVSLGGTATAVQLYLSNVDKIWQRAVDAEITIILPLEDTYWGERTGKIIDAFGHVWVLSRQTEVLSQKEIAKRAQALFGVNELDEDTSKIELAKVVPVIDLTAVISAEVEVDTPASATTH